MIDKKEFLKNLEDGLCPFCGKKLVYYDGALGYEAMRCRPCGFISDHSGLHFEEPRQFRCAGCGEKYPDSFVATDDVRLCRWCSGEEK